MTCCGERSGPPTKPEPATFRPRSFWNRKTASLEALTALTVVSRPDTSPLARPLDTKSLSEASVTHHRPPQFARLSITRTEVAGRRQVLVVPFTPRSPCIGPPRAQWAVTATLLRRCDDSATCVHRASLHAGRLRWI